MSRVMPPRPASGEVRAARIRAGLTQDQLAFVAGISRGTVDRIENGRGRVHRVSIEAVAAALGRDARDFLTGTPDA